MVAELAVGVGPGLIVAGGFSLEAEGLAAVTIRLEPKAAICFLSLKQGDIVQVTLPGQRGPGGVLATEPAKALSPVRAENPVHRSDQQICSPCRPPVMIIDHVPAVHVPPVHAASSVAAAVPA